MIPIEEMEQLTKKVVEMRGTIAGTDIEYFELKDVEELEEHCSNLITDLEDLIDAIKREQE